VLLGTQQRAFGGKTSDREAAGVGAPGTGRGRPDWSCSHPTTADGWKERCLHSPAPVTGWRTSTHESPGIRGGRCPPCSAASSTGSPPWPRPRWRYWSGGPAYAAQPQILAANDLPTIITNITTWITGLLIGVATLFLTIGGIRYLAAGGDPTEVEKAKSALKSALVGYALAVLAPILLTVVKGWIGG
jgi:Type IV secretion system pilin